MEGTARSNLGLSCLMEGPRWPFGRDNLDVVVALWLMNFPRGEGALLLSTSQGCLRRHCISRSKDWLIRRRGGYRTVMAELSAMTVYIDPPVIPAYSQDVIDLWGGTAIGIASSISESSNFHRRRRRDMSTALERKCCYCSMVSALHTRLYAQHLSLLSLLGRITKPVSWR